jgi:hypothetical protein
MPVNFLETESYTMKIGTVEVPRCPKCTVKASLHHTETAEAWKARNQTSDTPWGGGVEHIGIFECPLCRVLLAMPYRKDIFPIDPSLVFPDVSGE